MRLFGYIRRARISQIPGTDYPPSEVGGMNTQWVAAYVVGCLCEYKKYVWVAVKTEAQSAQTLRAGGLL